MYYYFMNIPGLQMTIDKNVLSLLLLSVVLLVGCQPHTNLIDDGPWDHDISDELDSLDNETRNLVLVLGAKAFSWITGTAQMNEYLDNATVASWFGYYYFKTANEHLFEGQTENVRYYVGRGMLEILNDEQRQVFCEMLTEYDTTLGPFLVNRLEILNELDLLKNGSALNLEQTLESSEEAGTREGALANCMATAFGQIYKSLSDEQRDNLAQLRIAQFDYVETEQVDQEIDPLSNVTPLSSMGFSWMTQDSPSDDLLEPTRLANYFGLAYYQSEPVPDGAITTPPRTRTEIGTAFLNTLYPDQRQLFYDLVAEQNDDYQNYLSNRSQIISELVHYQSTEGGNANDLETLTLESGRLDGQIAVLQATLFAEIFQTLTPVQLDHLNDLRAGLVTW